MIFAQIAFNVFSIVIMIYAIRIDIRIRTYLNTLEFRIDRCTERIREMTKTMSDMHAELYKGDFDADVRDVISEYLTENNLDATNSNAIKDRLDALETVDITDKVAPVVDVWIEENYPHIHKIETMNETLDIIDKQHSEIVLSITALARVLEH